MKLHEKIFISYKKNHQTENSLELEESKIRREENNARKANKDVKNIINNLSYDSLDNDALGDLEYSLYVEKKIHKNRKTHKSRLKELKKNKDFH